MLRTVRMDKDLDDALDKDTRKHDVSELHSFLQHSQNILSGIGMPKSLAAFLCQMKL
jgi:hypothetical protein